MTEEEAHGGSRRSLGEDAAADLECSIVRLVEPFGCDGRPVADIPAVVVIDETPGRSQVVSVGSWEKGRSSVEEHPIDDSFSAGGSTLGLQSLRDREPKRVEVVERIGVEDDVAS